MNLEFQGFDSVICFISKGGIPRSLGIPQNVITIRDS